MKTLSNFLVGLVITLVILLFAVRLFAQIVPVPTSSIPANESGVCPSGTCDLPDTKIQALPLHSPSNWPADVNIDKQYKKPGYYKRRAHRFMKDERMAEAILYASYGLSLAKHKRDIKRLQAYVNQEVYDKSVAFLKDKETEYAGSINTFEGINSAYQVYMLLWHTRTLYLAESLIQRLSASKANITIQVGLAEKIQVLTTKLEEYRKLNAETYYQAGKTLLASASINDKFSYRRPYWYFVLSNQYVSDYKDASALAAQTREKATLYVLVPPTRLGRNVASRSFISALDEQIRAQLIPHVKSLPFLKITMNTSQADYLLTTLVSNWDLQYPGLVTESLEFEREEGEGDKKIVKKAIVKVYTKRVLASTTVNYEMVQRNKQVDHSGNTQSVYQWQTNWASMSSGSRDIVPRKIRVLTEKKQDKFPSKQFLFHESTNLSAYKIAMDMLPLLKRLGSKLSR
ncbi:MAG: hypothetical protein AAGA02_11535 [Bacteroidota bacterium]